MTKQLLEIEPGELKFMFELKKQSSCSVQLTNNTYHYVAFKVKTTAPKKYSVRPNVGVLMPKSTCEFIVTMQAQRAAPTDMVCKDKFLIQSTTVPVETTNEDVTSSLFVKDDGRYIEENKLKVALITPIHSPELSPINGSLKNSPTNKKDSNFSRDEMLAPEHMVLNSVEHKMVNEELKHENGSELKPEEDVELNTMKDVEELKPEKDVELNTMKDVEELKPEKDVLLKTVKDVEELKPAKEAEVKVLTGAEELKLMEIIEEMKLKLNEFESKLNEAGVTISKLTEERRLSNLETKILEEKLAELSKRGTRKVQVGFPLLYVLMVAFISVFLGYRLHS